MITANFIHRTFRIRCDECAGTAFTVAVDGMQYLITARHVVKQFTSKVGLDIFRNGQWTSVPVEMIGQGKGEIDISVFAPKQRLSLPDLPVTPTSDGIV